MADFMTACWAGRVPAPGQASDQGDLSQRCNAVARRHALSGEDLALAAGPPCHRDELQSRIVKAPEGVVGDEGEHAMRKQGVVQVEKQPAELGCFVGAEGGDRLQAEPCYRMSTRATSALRYRPSPKAAGTG